MKLDICLGCFTVITVLGLSNNILKVMEGLGLP